MIKTELKITKDTFKNDKGEEIEYLSCVANINGDEIKFYPKAEYKKLLESIYKRTVNTAVK